MFRTTIALTLISATTCLAPPAAGQDRGLCHWYHPHEGSLEISCSDPGNEKCGKNKVCRQVYGGGWRDCFCLDKKVMGGQLPPTQACTSGERFWVDFKVEKKKNVDGPIPNYITMETILDTRSFMEYFDVDWILENGTLSQSMWFDLTVGQYYAVATYDLVSGDPNAGEPVVVRLSSFSATLDPGMALGYLSGTTQVTFDPSDQVVTATFDEANGILSANEVAECTVTNFLYPEGEVMWLELSALLIQNEWVAFGKAGMPVDLQAGHVLDPSAGMLTLTCTRAEPGAALVFGVSQAALGDVDLDRDVDLDDWQFVADRLGTCSEPVCPADVDRSGVVDQTDLDIVSANLGANDYGTTAIPGCSSFLSIANPVLFVATADDSGAASVQVPVGGIPLSAWHLQVTDPATCEVSNLGNFTLH